MRYQDWDVLLFPAGEKPNHIPLQEFRTSCFVELENNGSVIGPGGSPYPIPLVTTFVPTLDLGAPFQISFHSWSPTASVLASTVPAGHKPRELWQVTVVIDGNKVAVRNLEVDVSWPQVLSSTTTSTTGLPEDQLRFPQFYRIITGQNPCTASDPKGRIRVELATGYVDAKTGRFVKMHGVVNFAFQPAPMAVLQQTGIAWPNQRMFANPVNANPYYRTPVTPNAPLPTKHKRVGSTECHGLPGLPPSLWSGYQAPAPPVASYPIGPTDASSRSTSAYSVLTDSAAPLLPKSTAAMSGVPATIRLPSDQLQLIINALNPKTKVQSATEGKPTNQEPQASVTTTTMPPPPLPPRVVASKSNELHEKHDAPIAVPSYKRADSAIDATMQRQNDRREESRYSDVSMHAGCDDFPSCMSEDAEGRMIHTPPSAPAAEVKGRKEGTSAAKPRDFFSTILDPVTTEPRMTVGRLVSAPMVMPAMESQIPSSSSPVESRKRTRAALRSLNLNDGLLERSEIMVEVPTKVSRITFQAEQENLLRVDAEQESVMRDV